jgi:hypothetical protein
MCHDYVDFSLGTRVSEGDWYGRKREALLQLEWGFDECHGQTRMRWPTYLALQQPYSCKTRISDCYTENEVQASYEGDPLTRIVGFEPQNNRRMRIDNDRITAHWRLREPFLVVVNNIKCASSILGPVDHLELVAVEMEYVFGIRWVVDDELNYLIVVQDKRID